MRAMTRRWFGTDGVRGVAGVAPMRAEDAFALGRAATERLREIGRERPSFVLGMDPRISSAMLARAFTAAALARGADVTDVGVLPTPGVAFLTQHVGADAGVMISASHNPFHDNGVKLFDANGEKLSDEEELAIEAWLDRDEADHRTVQGADVGRMRTLDGSRDGYVKFLLEHAPFLDGLRVGLDCANGAASVVAPLVFEKLGARLQTRSASPDGVNINVACGSTAPEALQDFVLAEGLEVGVAFDGDGDRAVLVDGRGRLVTGDHMIAIIGRVRRDEAVVGTTMTNLGVERWLAGHDVALHRADVGDRYVHALLRERNLRLGGEASGHVLFLDLAPTGDGILTALQTLAAVRASGKPLEAWMDEIPIYPQVLTSVRVNPDQKHAVAAHADLKAAVAELEERLAGEVRVNVRPSGTEPLVRVMVEGEDASVIEREASQLVQLVERLGGTVNPA